MGFFDVCKECKMCCKSTHTYIHVHVFDHEGELTEHLCSLGLDTDDIVIEPGKNCQFLGAEGCRISSSMRPFHCRMYPLLYLPDGSMGIDPGCPHSGEYLRQLKDARSDAIVHFMSMVKELSDLTDQEKEKLSSWSRDCV